ncbi:MAG TPA: type II toxin-antitoxin system PemK/MazF family toxin [Sphingomicrobium sp.]
MTLFRTGDVVRVLFPHVETEVRRYRPALVVTDKPIGPDGILIWVAMITNARRRRWPGDIVIADQESVGLPIPSMVRTAKLATLEAASAARLGKLSSDDTAAVRQQISRHLGLG